MTQQRLGPSRRRAGSLAKGLVAAAALMSLVVVSARAAAEPSAAPDPARTPATSPVAAPDPTPAGQSPTPTSSPIAIPTASAVPTLPGSSASTAQGSLAEAAATTPFSLQVTPIGSPVDGGYFQDIGSFGFAGQVEEAVAGTTVEIYRTGASSTTWTRVVTTAMDGGGHYQAQLPVTSYGSYRFAATLGGAPGGKAVATSTIVPVTVADAKVSLDRVDNRIDSLKSTPVSGRVTPARPGVRITLQVRSTGDRQPDATAVTDASGAFALTFTRGTGRIVTYRVRASYQADNRVRTEVSAEQVIARAAVLNAVITDTTADEVALTYRSGCPVGPSRLKTITTNHYGRDKLMHRGLIIVREDLTSELIRGFRSALDHRYPIQQMLNPNVYGGNDPLQMEANNTSGFNCRNVVGNPYRLSPHSYGIAIDVNTVQNPYRDPSGKWWPKAGKGYIDRTPTRWGMLTSTSYLTRSLRADDFFWGGLWSPGRDYQHFEYRP